MTFTKEQLLNQARENVKALKMAVVQNAFKDIRPAIELDLSLAEMTLAGMEAEPIAWLNEDELPESYPYDAMFPFSKVDIVRLFPVYGPQPLTTSERAELENYRNAQQVVRSITQHFDDIALETAREIMCDVNRRHEFLGGEVQLLSRIQCRVDDACRAAMLQAGNSQAVTDGWVACSERMPEAGQYVLCLDNGDKYQNCIPDHDDIYTAAYCDRLGSFTTEYWGDHDWMSKRNPTHWSPLPDMPAAPQQEA